MKTAFWFVAAGSLLMASAACASGDDSQSTASDLSVANTSDSQEADAGADAANAPARTVRTPPGNIPPYKAPGSD